MRDKVVTEKSADRSNFCSCKKEKCMHVDRNSCSERRWKSYVIASVIMAFHNVQQIILYCGRRMILKILERRAIKVPDLEQQVCKLYVFK